MIAALMEGIAFVASIASISLLGGLLRSAKVYSQATEDQQLVSHDSGASVEPVTGEASQSATVLRNVS